MLLRWHHKMLLHFRDDRNGSRQPFVTHSDCSVKFSTRRHILSYFELKVLNFWIHHYTEYVLALCILQPVLAQDPTTSTTHSSTSASSESTTTAATTTNYATDSGGDGGLGNLADMSTTTTEEPDTTLIATTPVLQTRLPVDFNFTTPEFMGWPELGTG